MFKKYINAENTKMNSTFSSALKMERKRAIFLDSDEKSGTLLISKGTNCIGTKKFTTSSEQERQLQALNIRIEERKARFLCQTEPVCC